MSNYIITNTFVDIDFYAAQEMEERQRIHIGNIVAFEEQSLDKKTTFLERPQYVVNQQPTMRISICLNIFFLNQVMLLLFSD